MLNSRTRLATSTLCACFHVVIPLVLFMHQDLKTAVIPGHLDEQGFSGKTFLRFCASFFVAWLNPFAVRKFYKSVQALKRPSAWRRSVLEAWSRTDVQIVGYMQVRSTVVIKT